MHEQVWAKINVPVDKRVRGLVEALSAFPKLQTIESCEGGKDTPAWVSFYYGNSGQELANFVLERLGKGLVAMLGDGVSLSIQVKTNGLPQGELSVRPGAIARTVRALRDLAS